MFLFGNDTSRDDGITLMMIVFEESFELSVDGAREGTCLNEKQESCALRQVDHVVEGVV